MTFINYASREINCKIVYYGPGLCGKTTNLQHIYDATAPHVTNLSALKNAVVTSTRQLAMSGRIAQATAKSSAQAAGKCLELLAGN